MRPFALVHSLIGRRVVECTPETQDGVHGRLVGGLGLMGDAIVCLRCGRERYEEAWKPDEVARREAVTKEIRGLVAQARRLPNGLHAVAVEPAPDFEHRFRTGQVRSVPMRGRRTSPDRTP